MSAVDVTKPIEGEATTASVRQNFVVIKAELETAEAHYAAVNPHGTTAAQVGLANVENKSSAAIRSEITASDIATPAHAANAKATPVDADEITGLDSAASFGLIRVTWANVKATLKTYFDTLYAAAATLTSHTAAANPHSGSAPKGAVGSSGLTMSDARLLGRSTAATGAIEEITLGANLSFTGTTLNAAGGGGGGLSGLTTGRVPYATSATTLGDSSKLTFDDVAGKINVDGIAVHAAKSGGGLWNTAMGYLSMSAPTGSYNVALGAYAQRDITSASFCVGIGYGAQTLLQTGIHNIAVGANAQNGLTSGSYNTAIGYNAQANVSTGDSNMAFGWYSQYSMTIGAGNTSIGAQTLQYMLDGYENTAIGKLSLWNATKSYNTGVGAKALQNSTTAENNIAIGWAAGYDVTTGGNNTIIGFNSGRGVTTGINNTIVGSNVGGLAAALSHAIIIADGAGNQRITADSTGRVAIPGVLALGLYTVPTLPSAATSGNGARSHVSDALAPTFGATVVAGGAVSTPVYSDGTDWKVG